MKILLLLSLAAICLAKPLKGRSSFSFPGQPSADNSPHALFWDGLGAIGALNPERQSQKPETRPEIELRNPNRRDVKIGHFPALGFKSATEEAKQDNDIKDASENFLSVKSKSPLIKQLEPLFTENSTPILEKEEDSSSASSSSEKSSESAAASNQDVSSSSEENSELAAKSSSSEEINAAPLSDEESSAQSNSEGDSTSSDSNDSSQSTSSEEDVPAKVVYKKRDLAAKRPASSKKAKVLGSRPTRDAEFNFSDLKLSNSRNNFQEPQGQIKGANTLRRWRRPVNQ